MDELTKFLGKRTTGTLSFKQPCTCTLHIGMCHQNVICSVRTVLESSSCGILPSYLRLVYPTGKKLSTNHTRGVSVDSSK